MNELTAHFPVNSQQAFQNFLAKFKKTTRCPELISFNCRSNPNVFSAESQIPDLWLKTRTPFDRNLIFEQVKKDDKETEEKRQPNIYPKYITHKYNHSIRISYVIPDYSSLNTKYLHVDKVEIDDLFGGVKLQTVDLFSEDFDLNNPKGKIQNEEEDKAFLKVNEDIKEIIANDKVNPFECGMKSSLDAFHKSLEEEGLLLVRKWYLIIPEISNYGPYSSEEIFVFLSNLFKKSPEMRMTSQFMVWDGEQDIYFTPDSALEQLQNEMKDNNKTSINLPLNKLYDSRPAVGQELGLKERKLQSYPKLVTKFDVAEMNSKLKHVDYLPIHQLKDQLKSIKRSSMMHENSRHDYYGRTSTRTNTYEMHSMNKFEKMFNTRREKKYTTLDPNIAKERKIDIFALEGTKEDMESNEEKTESKTVNITDKLFL